MKKKSVKSIWHYVVFAVFLTLSVGYLPSQIGFNFLCMAALACPVKPIRKAVDCVLQALSDRLTWYLVFLVFMGCYPLNQFLILPERIEYLLNQIIQFVN